MKKLFTLLSSVLLTGVAFAQIPNPSFETWTTVSGYRVATGWDSPNPTTSLTSTYTCDSGMDSPPEGLAYMKLTAKTVPVIGVVPGVAVTGHINVSGTSYSVSGGFANTTRPANLTGKFKHMPFGADHGRIGAFLWKWNSATSARDTVAIIDSVLTGMEMTWTDFTMPFKYLHGTFPDSGVIVLSTSATTTPVANSTLYVDKLAFSGTVAGVINVNSNTSSAFIYPNPATGSTSISYNSASGSAISISMADMSGRLIKTFVSKTVPGQNDIPINLKGLAQGIYVIKITDGSGTIEKKLMVE